MSAPSSIDPLWDNLQEELDASFLQAQIWATFQHALDLKVHQLKSKKWSCLLIAKPTPFGFYLLAPYGPTLSSKDVWPKALAEITDFGRQLDARWLRLEPCLGLNQDSDFGAALFSQKIRAVKAVKQFNPLFTRILNLEPELPDILAGFSQTTRRIIRKNQNEPLISFKTSSEPGDMSAFIKMLSAVSGRNSVFFHPPDYFLKQAETLMPGGNLWLELALKDDQPIAAIVVCEFNQTISYLYAASLPEARSTSATALLLWQALLNAKAKGMRRFDLYGVAPEGAAKSHPWQGFSDFKKQFGGTVVRRGETIDIPLSPQYHAYRLATKTRRLIRF